MGLDMYLSKKVFVSEYGANDLKPREMLDVKLDGIAVKEVKGFTIELAYWRKQNAIHNWFVQHCGDGIDECQNIYVTREDLQTLLQTVNDALADREKAREILPTSSGFFFGDTAYDDWYWDGLEETAKLLENELDGERPCWEKVEGVYIDYEYRASW